MAEVITLMSFWSKVVENKLAVVSALAGMTLGTFVYYAYKQFEKQAEEQEDNGKVKERTGFNLAEEIMKLKGEIDTINPSLEDIKKIFQLVAEHGKYKSFILSNRHKEERRRRFPKEIRFARFPEYFKLIVENLIELQNTLVGLQTQQNQIFTSFGLTKSKIDAYSSQLEGFMQELMYDNTLTLEQTRAHLTLKNEYLQAHGETLIEHVIELVATLTNDEKQFIPHFINALLYDQVFEHQPDLDKEAFDVLVQKYRDELRPEVVRLQKALMPLMGRLQIVLGGQMQGYEENYPSDHDGDSMAFSQQAMQLQLQAIRQQNPQAYEQIMAMIESQRR